MNAQPSASPSENEAIAETLREMARYMDTPDANPYRAIAYRRAADSLRALEHPVRSVFDQGGIDALDALATIGPSIASVLAEILITGQCARLAELKHEYESARRAVTSSPTTTPPTITSASATLEHGEPGVEVFLELDADYRRKAAANALPRIAPKRENPTHEAWLPIMHTGRGPWHFSVLFSNTRRAHELGHHHDWVVVFFHDSDEVERRHTIVTETRGVLLGKRVVRGRERECRAFYAGQAAAARHASSPATAPR